jgi:hypothetical protein
VNDSFGPATMIVDVNNLDCSASTYG